MTSFSPQFELINGCIDIGIFHFCSIYKRRTTKLPGRTCIIKLCEILHLPIDPNLATPSEEIVRLAGYLSHLSDPVTLSTVLEPQ